MKIEFEIKEEQQVEIIREWAERRTDDLAKLLGPTYRRDLLSAMPEEEIREWVKHRDWETERILKPNPTFESIPFKETKDPTYVYAGARLP